MYMYIGEKDFDKLLDDRDIYIHKAAFLRPVRPSAKVRLKAKYLNT